MNVEDPLLKQRLLRKLRDLRFVKEKLDNTFRDFSNNQNGLRNSSAQNIEENSVESPGISLDKTSKLTHSKRRKIIVNRSAPRVHNTHPNLSFSEHDVPKNYEKVF